MSAGPRPDGFTCGATDSALLTSVRRTDRQCMTCGAFDASQLATVFAGAPFAPACWADAEGATIRAPAMRVTVAAPDSPMSACLGRMLCCPPGDRGRCQCCPLMSVSPEMARE